MKTILIYERSDRRYIPLQITRSLVEYQEQLTKIKQGITAWNEWRKKNPHSIIDLIETDLREANLREANLNEAFLNEAFLNRADLREANLNGAHLDGAFLNTADLSRANLNRAFLNGADLSKANLTEARLFRASLEGVDLRDANLRGAHLSEAYLGGANLSGANLNEAFLRKTDLSRANLSETHLIVTHFIDSIFDEAILTGAFLAYSTFGDDDLSTAIGLETIEHLSPSTIGVDTIRKSKGEIPENFLRGCGLSDIEIQQIKLAVPGLDPDQVIDIIYQTKELYDGKAIKYYSCFISYNNKDEDFTKRLHDYLQGRGVRCWFAPEDMKTGDRIRPTIDQQIRLRDKFLVVLSTNSVNSEWVGDEVEAALEEEKESGKTILFPIRLDDAVMEARSDWAAKIKRRRHIGDFSYWHDQASFHKAFEKLLADLSSSSDKVEISE